MIKQVILLSIFFLGLSGCDGFWENIYFVDKVYEGEILKTELTDEILVLRDTVQIPSSKSSYLFERYGYAEGGKKDNVNRILYATFSLIPEKYNPKKLELGRQYQISAKFDGTQLTTANKFCKAANYRPCLEKYDLSRIANFNLTSIEPIP